MHRIRLKLRYFASFKYTFWFKFVVVVDRVVIMK